MLAKASTAPTFGDMSPSEAAGVASRSDQLPPVEVDPFTGRKATPHTLTSAVLGSHGAATHLTGARRLIAGTAGANPTHPTLDAKCIHTTRLCIDDRMP